jgi:hypothetical protein
MARLSRQLAVLALLFTAAGVHAQDAHYWTLQFGPRSSLLGGAVIGSVSDISATYYNPGALGPAENLPFAVSTDVLELTTTTLEDGGGQGVDLGTTTSGLRPSMVAGTIKRGLFGGGTLAYSVLTRVRGTQDLLGEIRISGSDIPPDVQLDDIAAQAKLTGEFSDMWAGLSYGHRLGAHFGLGVTWYGAYRNQWRRRENIRQAIEFDGTGSIDVNGAYGKYSTIRTLAKVGGYVAAGPITGGVTLTTPSLHIGGSGQLSQNIGIFGTDTTALASNTQTGLDATYKSPLSIGAGLGVRIGGTQVHASAEWYDAIEPYLIMQGEPFIGQEPEVPSQQAPVHELSDVLNWGIAIEQTFSPKLSGYVSFYTDQSGFADEIEEAKLSINPIDISTITIGTDFTVKSARFTLGVGYGWGSKVDQELTDVLRERDDDFEATFVYRTIRLIFGFEI